MGRGVYVDPTSSHPFGLVSQVGIADDLRLEVEPNLFGRVNCRCLWGLVELFSINGTYNKGFLLSNTKSRSDLAIINRRNVSLSEFKVQ